MSTWVGRRACWPQATVRSLALLLLATCSLVINLAADNDTGASRAAFGSPMENRPDWLLPLFKGKVYEKLDGLMAGVAIRLDAYHLLMHMKSGELIRETFKDEEYRSDSIASVGFDHGVEFDSSKSSTNENQFIPTHYSTLQGNIGIYNMLIRRRWFGTQRPQDDGHTGITFEKPHLAESGGFDQKQKSWRGCSVLAWGQWNGSSGFDFSLRKIAVRDSDNKETPGKCKNALCHMNLVHDENTGGYLCGDVSALGAPVVCQSGKIEFIVSSYKTSNMPDRCTRQFNALRLDQQIGLIEHDLKESNHRGFHPGGIGPGK